MANPLVTVNILNFNRLHKLSYCLPSLIETACYNNWELSITDNCSKDGSIEYLKKEFEKRDIFRRLILLKKNYGEGRGALTGMLSAKGEVLVHSCNDLKFTRYGWLMETVKVLYSHPEIITYSPVITKDYGFKQEHLVKDIPNSATNSLYSMKVKLGVSGVPAFCMAIRKKDYDEMGGLKDCGKILGPKALRLGQWSMEPRYSHDVRELAAKRGYKENENGCCMPFLEDSAATHDWQERGFRDTVYNWDEDREHITNKIEILDKDKK